MGMSRYANSPIISGSYGTWTDPTRLRLYNHDILEDVECVEHVLKRGERLDVLSHSYFGDSELWWVIAFANRITDPFSLTAGTTLLIPRDAKSIIEKVRR